VNRPGGEGGVVDKVEQLLRITDGHQALHRQAEAHGLVLGRFIHWTGREGNRLLMGGGGASQKHKDQTITTHMHMFDSMRLARCVWLEASLQPQPPSSCCGGGEGHVLKASRPRNTSLHPGGRQHLGGYRGCCSETD